ncbi:MAG TPA: MlaD family protein [Gemmatimonadales bacterium]|nr:MlaD family protein [Gemmatimonadales bacterium]
MELRYGREAIVGALVIIAVAIFVGGTMWLSGRSLGRRHLVKAGFRSAAGLKRASPVTVSGVTVGRVEKIELAQPGKVIVSMSLRPDIKPKKDAKAYIASVTFVGDYVIQFEPGDSAAPFPADSVVPGLMRSDIGGRAAALSDRAESLMVGLKYFANEQTAQDLRASLKAFQGTMTEFQKTLRGFSDPKTGAGPEITRTMQSLQQLSTRLDTTLADPAVAGILRNTDTLTRDLAGMTRQFTAVSSRLDTLLNGVNQGRGTMGKLTTDSTLYYELRDLSAAMKGLVAELQKNPGKLGITVKVF